MRTLKGFLIAAGAAIALATALPAQEAGVAVPDEVLRLLDEGQALLDVGDAEAAIALFNEANDLTFISDDYDELVKHRPNLYQARYYRVTGRWQSVETFATSVASALDKDGLRDHPFRIEAILLQGIAAAHQGRDPEAERLLRFALSASEERPDLAAIRDEALFGLAEVATDLGAADAVELRDRAASSYRPGGVIVPSRYLNMEYLRLFERRNAGADPQELLPEVRDFLALVDGTEGVSAADASLYRGFLGLMMLEAGDYADALPLFEERHEFLVQAEAYGLDFFWNIQRIALARFNLENEAAGLEILEEWVPRGLELGAPVEQVAILTENIGQLREFQGDVDQAQAAYRDAYELMRRVRRATDELSVRIARRIDPNHPGMADFALRFEIASDWAPEMVLDALGSDVVRLFFEGDWRGVDAALAEMRLDHGNTAIFLVNEALYLAMTGQFEDSQKTLSQARKLARKTIGGELPANSMVFDIVDVVSKVWGTGHRVVEARDALDRLRAREVSMTRAERSVYLALEVFYDFRQDAMREAGADIDLWLANYDPDAAKSVWEVFAATMVLEASFGSVPEDTSLLILDHALSDLSSYPDMELAETYARLVHRINGATTLLTEGALTELGAMVQRVSVMVPPNHSIITATQFGMANSLNWRGRWSEALEWYERTTEAIRANPYHEPDVLAYLLSEQANMLVRIGEAKRGAVLAREALENVDLHTGRPNLLAGIVEAYVGATWSRTESAQQAGELLKGYIDDARFFDRLSDVSKVRMLNLYVSALANYGTIEEIREVVARSDAVMESGITSDWRVSRSHLAWQRAIAEYWNQDRALGFEMMRRSNDIYLDWRDDVLAQGASEDVGREELLSRAMWEALIGWDYAEQLPE